STTGKSVRNGIGARALEQPKNRTPATRKRWSARPCLSQSWRCYPKRAKENRNDENFHPHHCCRVEGFRLCLTDVRATTCACGSLSICAALWSSCAMDFFRRG